MRPSEEEIEWLTAMADWKEGIQSRIDGEMNGPFDCKSRAYRRYGRDASDRHKTYRRRISCLLTRPTTSVRAPIRRY
jgi:hypothetical protein